MKRHKEIVDAVVFCTGTGVTVVPLSASPEDFTGFIDDDLRVYMPMFTSRVIPDEILEVLNGYDNVVISREIRL